MASKQAIKTRIRAFGVVQGVGFRPFTVRLAREYGLKGFVQNRQGYVQIEAAGDKNSVNAFVQALSSRSPKAAVVIRVTCEALPDDFKMPDGFVIKPSNRDGEGPLMPSPDLAVCDECLNELFTPSDPRYLNPFISCTHCGPRYSIMRGMPYDRDSITMDPFPLCALCQKQYLNIDDRRYHAQTVCCNQCGPTLSVLDRFGTTTLAQAVSALKAGQIVAVKGIGGYHLACSPFDKAAVKRLRNIKGREDKAFAVMFENIQQVMAYCAVTEKERTLLSGAARPIVLLKRKPSDIALEVYQTSPYMGAFLPYTPLQHLILSQTGPLIMTSANPSSMPIIKDDDEMLAFFNRYTDIACMVWHNREILRRLDDSVAMIVLDQPLWIRRARGYAPLPIVIGEQKGTLVAMGAQEKSTACLYRDGFAYLTPEMGDLDTEQMQAAYREAVCDLTDLLRVKPQKVLADMHPGYASHAYAKTMGVPVQTVQHHHAHIASVMAEQGLHDAVIGVAMDGTGYGTDGTVWGGEFLLVSPMGFTRAGHLKTVPFLGGDDSVRAAYKSAACLMKDAGLAPKDARDSLIYAALNAGVNVIGSSSMGRLFDAVSAMLKICENSHYGGQAAIELENAAALAGPGADALPYDITQTDGELIADFAPCIREIDRLIQSGSDKQLTAYRFHQAVSSMILDMCLRLQKIVQINQVALSGGVFQNRLLLEMIVPELTKAGFAVYLNRDVPPGDGGIALGQTVVGLWSMKG